MKPPGAGAMQQSPQTVKWHPKDMRGGVREIKPAAGGQPSAKNKHRHRAENSLGQYLCIRGQGTEEMMTTRIRTITAIAGALLAIALGPWQRRRAT
jgi:hypothetical protein